jgi:branched-chain amino acid transport system permease protein
MTAASSPLGRKVRNNASTLAMLALGYGFLLFASRHFNGYQIQLLNLIAINAILALSLNFIYGFSGMFSLGHAGFKALGAYVSALCILSPEQKATIWFLEPIFSPLSGIHTSFFVSVCLGGLVAAFFSFIIALPVMRLGGDYLGIATLGFAEIIRVLLTNLVPLTNGAIGLRGIPSFANIWWNYVWLLITVFFLLSILKSNFGNVLKSIRDDEIAARTMGINTTNYRTMAFCVGCFFAGVGGALLGSLITTIEPRMFNFQFTFNILLIVVAGGLGSVTGSLVGSVVITLLLELLRIVEYPNVIDFSFLGLFEVGPINVPGIPGMRMVIFSLTLMFIILFRRKGIIGNKEFSWDGFYGLFGKIFSRLSGAKN